MAHTRSYGCCMTDAQVLQAYAARAGRWGGHSMSISWCDSEIPMMGGLMILVRDMAGGADGKRGAREPMGTDSD